MNSSNKLSLSYNEFIRYYPLAYQRLSMKIDCSNSQFYIENDSLYVRTNNDLMIFDNGAWKVIVDQTNNWVNNILIRKLLL